MNIEDYAYIKFMQVPPGWIEVPFDEPGTDTRAIRIFSPEKNPDVSMELFNRGYPLAEEDSEVFRQALSKAPNLIFERNDKHPPSAAEVELVGKLAEVLGNLGDNQVLNSDDGTFGPSFMLERIDTLTWKGKNVLAARGWYRDPERNVRVNDYCGFFIDANPFDPECQVEEIFLEAPTEEMLLKYMPEFQEALNSIEWQ